MSIEFRPRDIIHRITAKFYRAFLPKAKKPYILRPVHQPELDIHSVASKADVYNILTSPKVIEEGATAFMELATYLLADDYKIKTPLCTFSLSIPGMYDGTETRLPEGIVPEIRIVPSKMLQQYLREHVEVQIEGKKPVNGYIAEVHDRQSDSDTEVTIGGFITIYGAGMKIAADPEHESDAGVYFESVADGTRIRQEMRNLAVNKSHTIKQVTSGLTAGQTYRVVIRTQMDIHGNSNKLLKKVREMIWDGTLTAILPENTDRSGLEMPSAPA
jgi:hypothetical protein